ncbi:MAG: hypothetical protein QF464_04025, partial [Myxococcota bacterium]|nr:hypothetical protein [Myxococcota bacterium]
MTLPTANSGHWLRYTADRRTLFFVAGHFALIVASWLWNPTGPMAALAVILLGSSSYQCAVITHNVIHGPV